MGQVVSNCHRGCHVSWVHFFRICSLLASSRRRVTNTADTRSASPFFHILLPSLTKLRSACSFRSSEVSPPGQQDPLYHQLFAEIRPSFHTYILSSPPSIRLSPRNALRNLFHDRNMYAFVIFCSLVFFLPSVFAANAEQWRGRSIYQCVNLYVLLSLITKTLQSYHRPLRTTGWGKCQ